MIKTVEILNADEAQITYIFADGWDGDRVKSSVYIVGRCKHGTPDTYQCPGCDDEDDARG